MQIYDNRKPLTVNFREVNIGDTFFDAANENYAMRIIECQDDDGCANAVCLQTGSLHYYEEDEGVIPIKARIEVYA